MARCRLGKRPVLPSAHARLKTSREKKQNIKATSEETHGLPDGVTLQPRACPRPRRGGRQPCSARLPGTGAFWRLHWQPMELQGPWGPRIHAQMAGGAGDSLDLRLASDVCAGTADQAPSLCVGSGPVAWSVTAEPQDTPLSQEPGPASGAHGALTDLAPSRLLTALSKSHHTLGLQQLLLVKERGIYTQYLWLH